MILSQKAFMILEVELSRINCILSFVFSNVGLHSSSFLQMIALVGYLVVNREGDR